MLGYEHFRGHNCGVIEQTIAAREGGGALSGAANALGDALDVSMPSLEVDGKNLMYFDIDNGKLVHTDIHLQFEIEIGEAFGPLADLIGIYSDLLDQAEGTAPRSQTESPSSLRIGITSKLEVAG